MQRIPVLDIDGKPLMPTTAARARMRVKSGKAVGKFNDLEIYYVQLTVQPSRAATQPIVK